MADDWNLVILPLIGVLIGSIPSILSIFYGPRIQENAKIKTEKEKNVYDEKGRLMNIILTNIESFHVNNEANDQVNEDIRNKRRQFMDAYRHLWLYGTDDEIRSINEFLAHSGYKRPEYSPGGEQYQRMILTMRKSMIPNTNLTENDFYIASVR